MAKKIDSIQHKHDKRVHIPSKEEAGYEEANPKVIQGKDSIELPKNPVTHRGQDPEIRWVFGLNFVSGKPKPLISFCCRPW